MDKNFQTFFLIIVMARPLVETAARHVCDTYYKTTLNPIVSHHIDSYNDFVERRIPVFLKATNPIHLVLADNRSIDVYIGGKDGNKIGYRPPLDELENAIVPNVCRCENKTYALDVISDIDIDYVLPEGTETVKFEKIRIAQLPLMLRSKFCHLSALTPEDMYEQGEDLHELGGYFIIDGGERVLLSQERLGNNLFYAGKRKIQTAVEEEQVGGKTAERGEDYEYYAGIRSISEDGTRGPYSHYLVIPSARRNYSFQEVEERGITDYGEIRIRGAAVITLPGFKIPVPILSVLHLLGLTTDKDIYDATFAGIPQQNRTVYDDLFAQLILANEKAIRTSGLEGDFEITALRVATKTRSQEEVFYNLQSLLLPHIEADADEDTGSLYRRKAYTLAYLLRLCMENALDIRKPTDRDHFRFKRFDVSGDLCFQEFKRIYKEVAKTMKLNMDTRVHFEEKLYSGKGIVNLIQRESIGAYWKSYMFLSEFTKSFKGQWGGKDGISQILSRVSMLGTISQLRRSSLQMDPSVKALGARRLHGSSFGFTCPSDVPDGRNVGMIKHFSLLTNVSTQASSTPIKDLLLKKNEFRLLSFIHPATWNPSWTKIFINGDLYGIIDSNMTEVYEELLEYRRKNPGAISVAWNRTDNECIISSDPGRPIRPVYRPGIKQEYVVAKKSWKELSELFDFVDAEECDTIKISMAPFSSTLPSEIHGVFMLSPLSAVIPFCDHNPSPRVAFSCAQCRQGASWFHSNFKKRFDTITLILNSPQRPVCETWLYPHILGRGGCMPYGENAIVAIAMYTGYNQEDSILLNADSLKRGAFQTTYFHSYTILEELLDPINLVHSEFMNPTKKAIKLKADKDYSLLDDNGIIKVGSHVNEDTILVGIVVNDRDVSELPKRGQTGRVDAVQFFTTKDNLRGVKIRIAEHREPILGDKFSSRAGQKGTCGLIIPESDMPFTAKGLRPDLIINPHAIPSRMTTGQMLESMSARIGLALGCLIDSTPFTHQGQATEYSDVLRKLGLEPHGQEIFYNGMTGEMIEMEIFVGPTYYLRSKLMVEDKINYRDTGAKTLLTHQPLEGRASGGGLRIGEMERDALIAHGVSSFIEESFMKRSDEAEILFQPSTGYLDTTERDEPIEVLRMPYAMSLFVKEMESMHVSSRIKYE
jgi:DNA-directed RNA polymerase II subunit RPB2